VETERTGPVWKPRPLTFYGVEELGGWQTKVYGIAARGEEPRPALVTAARGRARRVLATRRGDHDTSAAFLVVHDARPACFVLVHWWDGVDLCQRIFRAPLDEPGALSPLETGAIGCVWELAVVAFEREVWVRHVLERAEPDMAGYLADRLGS